MKKFVHVIFITFSFIVMIFEQGIAQTNQFSGHISADTVWSSDTLEIIGDVIIDSNVTLTVFPGTFVHVLDYYSIYSYGVIKAIGTINDSITFTCLDTIYHSDTSTIKGGWHGIRLLPRSANDTSIFNFCRITNGKAVVPGSWQHDVNNYPDNRGANMYAVHFGSLIIKNSFIGNGISKGDGGGLFIENGKYVSIDSSHFKDNHCFYDTGGGACIRLIGILIVTNNLFNYNTAFSLMDGWSTGIGGAIAVQNAMDYDAHAEIVNNKLFNNYTNSGILYDSYYSSRVSNNLICNNFGSGIFDANLYNYPVYSNNTIANNSANTWAGAEIFSSNAVFINNIIWNNKTGEPQIRWCYHCDPPVIEYTDIMLGYTGEGNMDTDPLFTNPTPNFGINYDALEADWSLSDSSPLINAGVPDTTGWNIPTTDIVGNPRIYGIHIDMGAIENQNVLVSNSSINSKQTNWVVYPNPVKNEFRVKNTSDINDVIITLYDVTGKVLKKAPVNNQSTISVKQINPGIYFYIISKDNKTLKTGKWIKL